MPHIAGCAKQFSNALSQADIPSGLQGRAFQLDLIIIGVIEINRQTCSLRPIPHHGLFSRDTGSSQVAENGLFIKRRNAKAEVINIVSLLTRRLPTLTTDRPVHINQVNHGCPCAQMNHAKVVTALFDITSQYRCVESQAVLNVLHPQYNMVDTLN
ncbi:hypothetical protein ASC74_29755 [Pseudomonas sp. Root329]|nr:hypothetical protein ASC74_29755 [Pseudomonas sp. Root329]